jgi:hypothetical protein
MIPAPGLFVTLPAMNEVSNTTTAGVSTPDATVLLAGPAKRSIEEPVPAMGIKPAVHPRKTAGPGERVDTSRRRGHAALRPPVRWGINE